MSSDNAKQRFINLVEQSALSPGDKAELCQQAEWEITSELWQRFDELLVKDFEERQAGFREYRQLLDQEVVRYTRDYEREKKVIDREMRESLTALESSDEGGRNRLWQGYHQRIAQLQKTLLAEVKKTSRTSIRRVAASLSR